MLRNPNNNNEQTETYDPYSRAKPAEK